MSVDWDREPDIDLLRVAYDMRKTNPSQAQAGLQQLAERGSVMSMVYLAQMYESGIGVQIDSAMAENWYKLASDRGSVLATYQLGRLLLNKHDYSSAERLFLSGLEAGYAPAIHMLGLMYKRGQGVPKDMDQARHFFERAMDLGHIYAKRNLAIAMLKGNFGLRNIPKGLGLFISGIKDVPGALYKDRYGDRLR